MHNYFPSKNVHLIVIYKCQENADKIKVQKTTTWLNKIYYLII